MRLESLYVLLKIAATLPVISPRYLAAHQFEFCKTFRVLSRYVSLCMNVPSQTEVLLL